MSDGEAGSQRSARVYWRRRRDRDPVFARVIALFAGAVARFRGRRGDIPPTTEERLWDDDSNGGLATSGVRRRPPDLSGSGSAAAEPPSGD